MTNGYIEQFGTLTDEALTEKIYFPCSFKNSNYNIMTCSNNSAYVIRVTTKSPDSVKFENYLGVLNGGQYLSKGY